MLFSTHGFDEYASTDVTLYKFSGSTTTAPPTGFSLQTTGGVLGTQCAKINGGGNFSATQFTRRSAGGINTSTEWTTAFWFKTSIGFSSVQGLSSILFGTNGFPILNLTSAGSLNIYDNHSNSATLIDTVFGAGGQSLTNGTWHNVEVQFISTNGGFNASLSVAIDGVLISNTPLSQVYGAYTYQSIQIGNSQANTGSSILIDDIILWDNEADLAGSLDFTSPIPSVAGGGMVLTTLRPTTSALAGANPFTIVGAANNAEATSQPFQHSTNPPVRLEMPSVSSVPAGPFYGAGVAFDTPTLPSSTIMGVCDSVMLVEIHQSGSQTEALNLNEIWPVGGSPVLLLLLVGTAEGVLLSSRGYAQAVSGTPFTPSTAASTQMSVVWDSFGGDTIQGPNPIFTFTRDVLTAKNIPPIPKYVVICSS